MLSNCILINTFLELSNNPVKISYYIYTGEAPYVSTAGRRTKCSGGTAPGAGAAS